MRIILFIGDIAQAPAEALCSSTNPRLSLMMGTGAALRGRGGYEILRACEAILAASGKTALPPGSVHVTTAGALPCKRVVHCVASDAAHRSSVPIVINCVRNALAAAEHEGCRSIAMPLFASGHARMALLQSIDAIVAAIAASSTALDPIYVVLHDAERLEDARRAIIRTLPDASVSVESSASEEEPAGLWSSDW